MSCTVFYMNRRAPEEVCQIIRDQLPAGWVLATLATEGDYLTALAKCDFILVADEAIQAEHIAAAPHLRMIQHQGVGYERIDLEACRARRIPVALTFEGTSVPVAEHTLLLILALYRRLVVAATGVGQGRWMQWELRNTSFDLCGKQVGLIGMGRIGREVAKRCLAFGARVTYYDPAVPQVPELAVTRAESFEAFLRDADILSLHLPLTAENRLLINSRTLRLMKPSAVLINTSRGGLVDEAALTDALRAGVIRAAALDVLTREPPDPENPLLRMENVLITPHISAGTRDAFEAKMRTAIANLLRFARGEQVENVVPELRDLLSKESPCHSAPKN
jgi:phosphoglycerate dehydrogenase-like enzyme